LGQKEAVQLALTNSPSLQALLAQGWAESADAAQAGGLPTPFSVLSAWWLAMNWSWRALSLACWIFDLAARHGIATRRIEQAQLRLTGNVVDQVTGVRQAWVRAVAAQQTLQYAKQVYDSAEAGAELARRMQAWATSTASPVPASRLSMPMPPPGWQPQHQVTASREELVRCWG
jgi:outer membrane protein TolC